MPTIEEQFDAATRNLLELTMRNHILNYKQAKARTIKVVDEIQREVYNFLVVCEKAMEFFAKWSAPAASSGAASMKPAF